MKKDNSKSILTILLLISCFKVFGQNNHMAKKLITFTSDEKISSEAPAQIFKSKLTNNPDFKFNLKHSKTDKNGFTIQTFEQSYKDILVEFGDLKLISKSNKYLSLVGEFIEFNNLSVKNSISIQEAFNYAKAYVGADKYLWEDDEMSSIENYSKPEGEKVIIYTANNENIEPKLAIKFDIYAMTPLYRANIYIDAQSGEVLLEHVILVNTDVPGSGQSSYNGNVNFLCEDLGNGYYDLSQVTRGNGIEAYDYYGLSSFASNVSSSQPFFNNNPEAVQAYWSSEKVYDYYNDVHGRNSYDDNGALIRAFVNRGGQGYQNNAYWDGSKMVFGEGDGTNYNSFASTDVVGHEFTHGVIQQSANLLYQGESGALNESFADIFGEMIEYYATNSLDWLVGQDIVVANNQALRSLMDPNTYNQPDTYGGTYWANANCSNPNPYNDYCGVHRNSGVQNFWFYLLANGGVGTNDIGNTYAVDAIGIEKAQIIAYENLTKYLSPNSTFADARAGSIQAAVTLYGSGSDEEKSVTNAWYAVGVGPAYGQTGNNLTCATGQLTVTFTFDDHPEDTQFLILNNQGQVMVASGSYANQVPWSTVSFPITNVYLAPGDYTFMAIDRNGDGLNTGGSYELTYSGGLLANGSAFAYTEATQFCIDATSGNFLDVTNPDPSGNLMATYVSHDEIHLAWDVATDNVAINSYSILETNSINSIIATVYANQGNSIVLDASNYNIQPNTTYTFKVLSRDTRFNLSNSTSNTITVTTPSQNATCSATNTLSLELNFDAEPEEVAWLIRDTSNTIVASSGGQYVTQVPNSNLSVPINNLINGDYVFIVFDRGGDGTGNYALTDANNTILFSGSSFEYSQSFQFCVGASNGDLLDTMPPTAPQNLSVSNITSNSADLSWIVPTDNTGLVDYVLFSDGEVVGNFYHQVNQPLTLPNLQPSTTYRIKMAVTDLVGNFSMLSNEVVFTTNTLSTVLNEGFFETGWDGWSDGGNDCHRINEVNQGHNRSYEGIRSIRLRDDSGLASSMTLPNLDLSQYNSVELEFYTYVHNFNGVEDFWVLYYDGTSWINVGTFVRNVDFTNGTYNKVKVLLSTTDYNFPINAQFRIQCDASGNGDHIYVDQTKVTATTQFNTSSTIIQQVNPPLNSMPSINNPVDIKEHSELKLFPNPVKDSFQISSSSENKIDRVEIYNINGRLVKTFKESNSYNIQEFNSGIYFVKIFVGESTKNLKLVKN